MNKLEDWWPCSPTLGPPLPKWMGIKWLWYKPPEEEVPTPEEVPPLAYKCPYCDQSFTTLKELIDHAAAVHPDQPMIGEITIEWG